MWSTASTGESVAVNPGTSAASIVPEANGGPARNASSGRRNFDGPQPRRAELLRAARIFPEFLRGVRALHVRWAMRDRVRV
jgi:hypothetical protein